MLVEEITLQIKFLVTGFPLLGSILLIGVVGIFYTSFGGLRAVIWTDFLQGLLMFGGVSIIIIKVIPFCLTHPFERYLYFQFTNIEFLGRLHWTQEVWQI